MIVDKTLKRPILRYHGGKWILAPWIISNFPEHRVYVELFGGGGSVLLRKPKSYAEVYNDVWDIVVNVFQVLRDPDLAAELERVLKLTPFSRYEFDLCGDFELNKITDPVEKARRTILRSFAGFGSASTNANHSTGFRANSNRSGTTPAHDWANYPSNLKSFVERLSGVVIERRHYSAVLQHQDSEQTLFYADPPYVHVTRNMLRGNAAYAHEMTNSDHEEMCNLFLAAKGMIVLSGYDNDIYNDILRGWEKITKNSFADGAKKRVEVLWINPQASDKLNNKLI